MTKNELVSKVAELSGVSKGNTESVLDALVDRINIAVRTGEEVAIPGLGKFSRKAREARQGRNPATGEAIQIAARRVPHFKPAKAFTDAVA